MKRDSIGLAILILSLLSSTYSYASWGGFVSLGTTPIVGEPSCVQTTSNDVLCVSQSQRHTLMANRFTNGTWSVWTNIAGTVVSDPSCASDGAGNIICGVTGTKNTLEAITYNGSAWGAFVDSGQSIYSNTYQKSEPPTCARLVVGSVFCAVRSQSSTLIGAMFNGTAWSSFVVGGGASLTTAPSCASDSDGRVICIAQSIFSSGNNSFLNRFDGTKWEGVIPFGTAFITPITPNCVGLGGGSFVAHAMCTLHGLDSLVYSLEFNGGPWLSTNFTGFQQISGSVMSRTSCAITTAGTLVCGWINAADSLLYESTFNGSSWSGYVKVGGPPIVSGPACAPLRSGKVLCLVVGLNNQALSTVGP